LDGVTTIPGGWIEHNWQQLSIQFAYVFAVCGYTFVVTAIIAKGVDLIPGLHLRSSPEAEKVGTDEVEIGEFAADYIELWRDFRDGFSRQKSTCRGKEQHNQEQSDKNYVQTITEKSETRSDMALHTTLGHGKSEATLLGPGKSVVEL